MFGFISKLRILYSRWLHNVTLKQVLFFTLLFILTILFVLPYVSELSIELLGSTKSIDTGFHNDIAPLYEIREEYGHQGRINYVLLRITFDLYWPICYFLFYASITAYLTKHITDSSKHRYINYIPIIAIVLDFTENVLSIIFVSMYPYRFDLLVFFIVIVSLNKWLWIAFNFINIIWLSIKRGLLYVRK